MKEVIMKVPSFSADYPKAPIYVADLVRCKECRWLDKGENESCSWSMCTRHIGQYINVDDEAYCSYGEREGE